MILIRAGFHSRSVPVVFLATIASVLAIVLGGCGTQAAPFSTRGNRIVQANGERLIIRGVTAVYGTWAGGDASSYGYENFARAPVDFTTLSAAGVNLIRILVTNSVLATGQFRYLRRVVAEARERGLIVDIAVDEQFPAQVDPLLRRLASTYRSSPYVWLDTSNEPLCPGSECSDWSDWQHVEQQYIRIVRRSGDHSIIVVDGPSYAEDLSQLRRYPLSGGDLLYAAHMYGNDATSFGSSEESAVNAGWASAAARYPVFLEEVGSYNGPTFANSMTWLEGFIPFVTQWVRGGLGSGAVGFTWHWVDPNSMTTASYSLTPWGQLFFKDYVEAIR